MRARLSGVLGAVALLAACGGKIVVDGAPEGAGGQGGDDLLENAGGAGVVSVASSVSVSVSVSSSSSSSSSGSSSSVGGAPPVGPGPGGTGGVGGEPLPPSIPHLVEIPFGPVPPTFSKSITTDARTISLTFAAVSTDPFDEVGIRSLVAPTGEVLIDDFEVTNGPEALAAWYGSVAASVPECDSPASMPVAPGKWSVAIGAFGGSLSTTTLTGYVRQTADGGFHGGALDVNVFASPSVDQAYALQTVTAAFAGYAGGLELGTITTYAVPPKFDAIGSVLEFFDALELTGAATTRPALNVVVTASFGGELFGVAGIAAGIPGNGMRHGTHSSGLVISTLGDLAFDAATLQHETGHVSGLFHTTEIDGGLFDALVDTPTCTDVDGLLETCPDAGNVMFPYALGGQFGFTALQNRVLQGSTLYRGVVEPGGAPAAPEAFAPAGKAPGADGFAPSHVDLAAVTKLGAFVPTADDVARARAALLASQRDAASPARDAWRARLPAAVAVAVGGARCDLAPLYEHAQAGTTSRLAAELASVAPARWLEVARDAGAPAYVRERALDAYGRAPGASRAELEAIALDESLDDRVRAGALRGLAHVSEPAARALASRVTAPPRSLLRVVADEMRR